MIYINDDEATMSYIEAAMDRQYEAWMEQEREWYDLMMDCERRGMACGKLNRYINTEEKAQMCEWMMENYPDKWEMYSDEFILPTEQDVQLFLLRWL